jgi:two-component system, sensor histidine kinase and response regulator
MDEKIFDQAAAMDRVGGDLELLIELAGMFLDDQPRMMDEIKVAVDSCDGESLHRSAHAIKGAVGNFSAQQAFDAALKLEMLGRGNDFADAKSAFESLEEALGELEPALSSL